MLIWKAVKLLVLVLNFVIVNSVVDQVDLHVVRKRFVLQIDPEVVKKTDTILCLHSSASLVRKVRYKMRLILVYARLTLVLVMTTLVHVQEKIKLMGEVWVVFVHHATNGKMIKLVLSVLRKKVMHVQEKIKLIVDVDVNAQQATKGKMV